MAVESDDDLAVFFNPDEFGESMVANMAAAPAPAGEGLVVNNGTLIVSGKVFKGILTTGYIGESPGSTAAISMMVPRIIAIKRDLEGIAQGDTITMLSGQQVYVNDMHYKGALVIIHFHEHW